MGSDRLQGEAIQLMGSRLARRMLRFDSQRQRSFLAKAVGRPKPVQQLGPRSCRSASLVTSLSTLPVRAARLDRA